MRKLKEETETEQQQQQQQKNYPCQIVLCTNFELN